MSSNANLYAQMEPGFVTLGEKLAFETPSRKVLSYDGVDLQVARIAGALAAAGVEAGDRVMVQAEKSIEGVVLYLATLKLGAIFNPLNTAYTEAELDYFMGDAEPKVLVCDSRAESRLGDLARRHGVNAVLTMDADGSGTLKSQGAASASVWHTAAVEPDDIAALVYTSGTTGRSKGAMLSHGNLSSNARTLLRIWKFWAPDVLLHALPTYHVHGLFVALNTALLNRSKVLLMDRFDAAEVARLLPRATVFMGVPTYYTRLLAEPTFTAESCRHIRLFVSGSAPLLAETHKAFEARTGHRILERYGMTETGMITSNPCDGERVAGSVGMALPDVSVRVADEDGRELPRGEVGVVEVKGPNVFKGYWRMPEKSAEGFRPDGYFITGDQGVMDTEGRLRLVGRAKDMIISGGLNVYPVEIEEALNALPGVGESAVFGIPHPDFGEAVVAVITPAADTAAPTEAAVIAALSETLARFKQPKRVLVQETLPRNAMGKVQKAELRRQHAELFKAN